MAKVGILGPREQVQMFRALGAHTVFAETALQAQRAFETMVQEDYAVICCAQTWYDALRPQIEACADRPLPAVVVLRDGERGAEGPDPLEAAVQRAVGTQIQ